MFIPFLWTFWIFIRSHESTMVLAMSLTLANRVSASQLTGTNSQCQIVPLLLAQCHPVGVERETSTLPTVANTLCWMLFFFQTMRHALSTQAIS